jgi:hypothetical protein
MTLIELLAALCGLAGSLVLALRGKYAAWGWALFVLSNVGWIAFAAGLGHWFLLAQQLGFLVTSAVGVWQWLLRPWWTGARK